MRRKQAKKLRRQAAIIAPKKQGAMIDRITGRVKVENRANETGVEIFDLYTRFWEKDSSRRIYRALKKVFKNIPIPKREKAVRDLDKMQIKKA